MRAYLYTSLFLLFISTGFSSQGPEKNEPSDESTVTLSNGKTGYTPVLIEDHSDWFPVEYAEFPKRHKSVVHKFKPKTVPTGYFRNLAAEQRRKIETEAEARRQAATLKKKGEVCGFCTGLVALVEKVVEIENSFTKAKTPLRFGCGILTSEFKDLLPSLDCEDIEKKFSQIEDQHKDIKNVVEDIKRTTSQQVEEDPDKKCKGVDCDQDDSVKVSLGGCSFLNIDFCKGEEVLPTKPDSTIAPGDPIAVATPIIVAAEEPLAVEKPLPTQVVQDKPILVKNKKVLEPEPVVKSKSRSRKEKDSRDTKIDSLESKVKALKEQNESILAALKKWEASEEEELQEEEEDSEDDVDDTKFRFKDIQNRIEAEGGYASEQQKMSDLSRLHRFREILEKRYNEEEREIEQRKHKKHAAGRKERH